MMSHRLRNDERHSILTLAAPDYGAGRQIKEKGPTMGMLDGILGEIGGGQLNELGAKLGLSPEQIQAATAALGKAHAEPGDTVASASAATGLSADTLTQLMQGIGGEGTLASISSMLDRDGDGNPLDDIAGFASKLFGK